MSPGTREKTYVQKFYLYMNLTKPTESLILSYSRYQQRETFASRIFSAGFGRLFPALCIEEEEEQIREKNLRKKDRAYLSGKRTTGKKVRVSDRWKELYTWYAGREEEKDNLKNLLTAAFYKRENEAVTKEKQARLCLGRRHIPV